MALLSPYFLSSRTDNYIHEQTWLRFMIARLPEVNQNFTFLWVDPYGSLSIWFISKMNNSN